MKTSYLHRVMFLFALGMAVGGCGKKPPAGAPPLAQVGDDAPEPATLDDFAPIGERGPSEMQLGLSEAEPGVDNGAPAHRLGATQPLSAQETARVLGRLPQLTTRPDDATDFAKRANSAPPPRTGDVVATAFPPDEEAVRPTSVSQPDSALRVLRQQPEGDVPIAPHLSVTFNKPMVTLGSHDDAVAENVPVRVTPLPDGKWRWVGTQTLLFEPADERFAMATEYSVEVPRGSQAATKEQLASAVRWSFRTPTPTIKRSHPQNGTFGLQQVIFIEFDQRIDAQAVLEKITLKTGGIFQKAAVRFATPEEIESDVRVKALVDSAEPQRWVALRAVEDLPYDSEIRVVIPKGTPSAEGPLTTPSDQRVVFKTYGPLKVVEHQCGWGHCTPTVPFVFRLTNIVDNEKFDESMISIKPEIPGVNIVSQGQWIYVHGRKTGRRKYDVTIDRTLTDEFGQALSGRNQFSFDVGPAQPTLTATVSDFTVLDPSAEPALSVFSTNYAAVRLKAWRVDPSDLFAYRRWNEDHHSYGKREVKPPGKLVLDQKISLQAKPDELVETSIPLAEALGKEQGNIIVLLTPAKTTRGTSMPDYRPEIRTWVQRTNIAIDAFVEHDQLLTWVTALDSGEPLGGATVELGVTGQKAKTDSTGLARIDLATWDDSWKNRSNFLAASHANERGFLPEQVWSARQPTQWVKRTPNDDLAWYVFDDRGMYKPGEKVTVKGWLRAIERRENGLVRLATGIKAVGWIVRGPQGNELARGEAKTSPLGGFDLEFNLSDTPNLGRANIELRASGATEGSSSYVHAFQIQEFRTPEFEVSTTAPEGPFFATEDAVATVEANYYAGGGLPNAEVRWDVTASASSFTPPNQHAYVFGSWTPWWAPRNTQSAASSASMNSKTDPTGAHDVRIAFGEIVPPRPMSVRAQATVYDVNRQAWSSTTTMLVHPSQFYVGLKSDEYFVERGQPLDIDLVVADVDGNAIAGRPVKVRAARVDWTYSKGRYEEVERDIQECDLVTQAEANACSFATPIGGRYRIVATTVDDYGRANFTEVTRWVSGGKRPVSRRVEFEAVELIPDRDEYQPGDTARILVQSPIVPAQMLLTVQRQGILEERRFTTRDPTMTVEIPIKHTHMPNLQIQVNVVGAQPRVGPDGEAQPKLPHRPAYGGGSLSLKIPPSQRVLTVDIEPTAARVGPAEATGARVRVVGTDGKPVANAEVAVVVVDEAVLALSAYAMADPMNVFYPHRAPGVRTEHFRRMVELSETAVLENELANRASGSILREKNGDKRQLMKAEAKKPMSLELGAADEAEEAFAFDAVDAPMAPSGGANSGAQPAIAVRTNFNPLAVFVPASRTNADGVVDVSYTMPDNLTRYRIMAVAVDGAERYGTGESNVTARLPLMVRPSAPRFLNFGDKFELPVVLQNQTDEPMTVDVASRGSNVEMLHATGWRVQVPANDRVEVRFPATTAQAGTARFQVGAAAGTYSDASEFSLPVWTPATSEAFATYGVVDKGAIVQPVQSPTDVWPQFGGLEVTTSSTALQALTDAFIYLYEYEYQCAEQISSRMVSVAALRDVLAAFQAEGMPDAPDVQRSMERDIEELVSRQNRDGGFGIWRRGQPSWPYVTIHASHALTRAKQKGYAVPDYALKRAQSYLRNIESFIPHWWSKWWRLHAIAYSLYVRGLMGDRDPAKARDVIRRGGKLDNISFESIGWLLGVLSGQAGFERNVADLRRFLNNRVTETAAGAHFAAHTKDSAYVILHSDRVADGVIVEAMIDDQPKSDLIPKIVNGLMAHRKKGRWGNTQENAFVLLALDKYFNTFEKQTPNFVAKVWLGEQFAGEHAFKGRTTERHHVDVPMRHLGTGPSNLYLQKDGTGRMYYRIGMNYAPKSLELEPADHGFVVERAYEPVDDDNDVKRRNDGSWEIKAGAKVRVKLTMVAPTRRYHVALVDPLPAGLETLNPALAVTGDVPPPDTQKTGRSNTWGWWWWTRPWFEHQNMRDERTEAFTTLLWGGVHTYEYYARATTPGEFVVPPAKAEEMYSPETFGRSATDRVNVVD